MSEILKIINKLVLVNYNGLMAGNISETEITINKMEKVTLSVKMDKVEQVSGKMEKE